VSWRAATDLRRLPTADWLLDEMDGHVPDGDVLRLVTAAAWLVVGGVRWEEPPSVPLLITAERLVVGHRRGRVGRRAEVRVWLCRDLTLRTVRPLRGDAAFTVVEFDHWTTGLVSIVFVSPAEAEVVTKLVTGPGGCSPA
jgi:hypothetical protein